MGCPCPGYTGGGVGVDLLPVKTAGVIAAALVLLELPLLFPSYYNIPGPNVPGI